MKNKMSMNTQVDTTPRSTNSYLKLNYNDPCLVNSDFLCQEIGELCGINNLRNSAIQSEEIIFILHMWQRGSLSEHNDSKSWRIDSKSWCHERQVRFLLKHKPSTCTTHTNVYQFTQWSSCLDRSKFSHRDR